MSMYSDFLEEDIIYIENLFEDIKKFNKVYKSKIFEEKLPLTLRETLKALKQDLLIAINEMQSNVEKAKERRRQLDATHYRLLTENKENLDGKGREPENSSTNVTGTQQENLGTSHEKNDGGWREDLNGQISDGITNSV